MGVECHARRGLPRFSPQHDRCGDQADKTERNEHDRKEDWNHVVRLQRTLRCYRVRPSGKTNMFALSLV